MKRSDFLRIPLQPFGPEDCESLLCDLLGRDPSLDALRSETAKRSGGNPFYAEKLALAYAEAGAFEGQTGSYRLGTDPGDVVLPDSVHGLLAARIDRLGDKDKQALQAAGVIGREFSEPVLARVVELEEAELAAALDGLCRAELIHPTSLYPEAEYAFKHPLTHEVALASQLGERCARTHAATARAIEALTPASQLDEQAALLAHHWEESGLSLIAATWHRRAAVTSHNRDASATMMHWQRVASLAAAVPETDESARLRLEACREIVFSSWRVGLANATWQTVLDEGIELARRLGDRVTHATLLSGAAGRRGFAGEHRVQVEMLEEALSLAEEEGDFALQASLYQRVGWAWAYAGDHRRGLDWSERGVAFCERDPERAGAVSGFATYPWLVAQTGFSMIHDGRLDEGDQALARAEQLLEGLDDDFTRGYVLQGRSIAASIRGDTKECHRSAARFVEYGKRVGNALSQHLSLRQLAGAMREDGDASGALGIYEQARAIEREFAEGAVLAIFQVLIHTGVALAAIRVGNTNRGRRALQEAEDLIARKPELEGSDPAIDLERIETWLLLDGIEARTHVEERLAALLQQAHERGCRSYEPLALQQRARLRHLLGNDSEARADLEEARRLFASFGATKRVEALDRMVTD
ncbi:MAG: hypothetical protein GY944_23285 [bacterium]|nr:hypothetical protein [bacterium]